jgi:hypothetical protein
MRPDTPDAAARWASRRLALAAAMPETVWRSRRAADLRRAAVDVVVLARRRRRRPPVGVALAVAAGAAALGAVAIGTLAIGSLAIGRLRLREARIDRLEVGDLTVGRLRRLDTEAPAGASEPSGAAD